MDLNDDGFKDIFSGSYSRNEQPMAGLFQVLYGKADGSFGEVTPLDGSDGNPLVIPSASREESSRSICTRPSAVDWDNDGDLDLIVGNFEGSFFLFNGEGKGQFAPQPTQLQLGDMPLQIMGIHSDPCVIDWDGDGDLDIVSGSSQGGAQWSENTAGTGKLPALTAFRDLIPSPFAGQSYQDPTVFVRRTAEEPGSPGMSTRVWVADLNNDNKLDILLGDATTLMSENPSLTKEQFEEQFGAWASVFKGLMDDLKAVGGYQVPEARPIQQKMQTHWQKKANIVSEERSGFVWAYLQK